MAPSMSSISRSGSRLGIDQLRLNPLPERRFDGAPGDQVHPAPQGPFELLPQIHETQTDRGVDLDQDIHVAVVPGVTARPGPEQGRRWIGYRWLSSSCCSRSV